MAHRCMLYIPPQLELLHWVSVLGEGAERAGWHPARVVQDWEVMWDLLTTGRADIALTTSLDHLPPDRCPRLEFLDRLTNRDLQRPIPRFRRPRRLDRPDAADA